MNKKKYLKSLLGTSKKEFYNMPRQSLKKVYWQTAYLDMIKYKTIVDKKSSIRFSEICLEKPNCI